nr:hypothetical protein [Tanacetum cinerariifolium]
ASSSSKSLVLVARNLNSSNRMSVSFESPFGGFPFQSINSPNWVDALLPPVLAVASDLVFLAGRGLSAGRGRAS